MVQNQMYKRTFTVLTGLALVFLLAFYGLVGQDNGPIKTIQNQMRKQNQEKVFHFRVQNKNIEKESSANDLTLETTTVEYEETTAEGVGEHIQSQSSLKKELTKNVLEPLNKFQKIRDTLRDQKIKADDDFEQQSTYTRTMSTKKDLRQDVKSQSTERKQLLNTPLNQLKVNSKSEDVLKPTSTREDGDESNFQSTAPMTTLSTTTTSRKYIKSQSYIDENIGNSVLTQGKVLENSGQKLEGKTKIMENTDVKERFVARRKRKNRLCDEKDYKDIKPTKYIVSFRSQFANGRLRWCQIPKIATTFLKYVRRENAPSLKRQGITQYPRSQRKSFFLVREPYSRLVSGFICKIVTTPQFWSRYGRNIISKYRPNAWEGSRKCGHDVSFPEFIKYFIRAQETGLNKNKHFMPIHEQCSICRETYDYIVHLETLKPDLSYIFNSVNATIDIDIRDTESEIVSKSTAMMTPNSKRLNCFFPCQRLRQVWWSFQARGFISTDSEFPLGDVECKTISVKRFTELAINACKQFTDKEKRSAQKKKMMTDLYLQVSLEDRVKVKDILMKDFELFEYEPEPKDVFPEFFN